MKNKEKKEIKEQFSFQEDLNNSSEESFNRDLEFQRSNIIEDPQNSVELDHLKRTPASNSKFNHISRDVTQANIKERLPDPDYLNLLNQTIVAFTGAFLVKKRIYVLDDRGEKITEKNTNGVLTFKTQEVEVFDENLRVIVDFLESDFDFNLVSSRAMGDYRFSKLDKSSFLEKGIKKGDGNNNQRW